MPSSLFGSQPQSPQMPSNMVSQLQQFAKQMQGKDPKQAVMNMLQSGQMSNPQYQQLLAQAKQFAPMLKGLLK